jgi:hypothetical protein
MATGTSRLGDPYCWGPDSGPDALKSGTTETPSGDSPTPEGLSQPCRADDAVLPGGPAGQASRPDNPLESAELADMSPWQCDVSMPEALGNAIRLSLFVMIGVLGLFTVSQVMAALRYMKEFPQPLAFFKYPYLILVTAFVGLLGYVMFSLCRRWLYLRTNRQINLQALEALRARSGLQQQAIRATKEAKKQLKEYVGSYPVSQGQSVPWLTDKESKNLRTIRDRLLQSDFADSRHWIADYCGQFQSILDIRAKRIIDDHAKQGATATVILSNSLVNSLVVLYKSTKMISDLCRIYNLKIGRQASGLIVLRVIVNVLLAGSAQQLSEQISGTVIDEHDMGRAGIEHGVHGALGTLENTAHAIGASVAKKVLPKAAEWWVNYRLLRWLGKATIRYLQPVRC